MKAATVQRMKKWFKPPINRQKQLSDFDEYEGLKWFLLTGLGKCFVLFGSTTFYDVIDCGYQQFYVCERPVDPVTYVSLSYIQ